jgi:lambda repressor-like predicted transcriptional regulator
MPNESDERFQRALAELRRQNAAPGPPSKLDASTRKRVSAGVLRYHAQRIAADPDASPVKRARYEKGWSLRKLAEHAGLCLNACWAAETTPEKSTRRTRVSISRALGSPTKALFPPNHARP